MIGSGRSRAFRTLGVVGLTVLASCVPNRMYRVDSIEQAPDYSMAVVEFDDQGELWSEEQLDRAVQMIRESNDGPAGAIVFLFIHGWNHNAASGDSHAQGFDAILRQVAAAERAGQGVARPVVGVYLGWRGKNVKSPLLLPFSFFNRRGTAERIAGTAATEVIYRVALSAKENDASKVVLLGHSFGGLILERAVTQAMVGALMDSKGRRQFFPADAVILLNPASQSIHAKGFIEMLERERVRLYRTDESNRRFERPLIVSITSSADRATKWLFPIGLGLKSLNRKFRKYEEDNCTPIGDQKTFFRRTAGHNSVMLSHTVQVVDEGPFGPDTARLDESLGSVVSAYDPVTQKVYFVFAGEDETFQIKRRARSQNDSPYWIIRVPRDLIAGHSDVFGVNTVRLVGAILGITGALERESRTELVHERAMYPIELVPYLGEEMVVLDRSRRIYRVSAEERIESSGCIPQDVDAADRIGVDFGGASGRVVLNRRGERRWNTEVPRIRLTAAGPELMDSQKLDYGERLNLAAVDLDGQRVFLAPPDPGRLLVANLSEKQPRPEVHARLEGVGPLSVLEYDGVHDRLYFTDGSSGAVFTVVEADRGSRTRIVAGDLGLPVGIAADGARDALYVIDASSGDVLRFECDAGFPCAKPAVISTRQRLNEPSSIEVSSDGTVWIASLESQRVIAVSPEGELVRAIDEWPGLGRR